MKVFQKNYTEITTDESEILKLFRKELCISEENNIRIIKPRELSEGLTLKISLKDPKA